MSACLYQRGQVVLLEVKGETGKQIHNHDIITTSVEYFANDFFFFCSRCVLPLLRNKSHPKYMLVKGGGESVQKGAIMFHELWKLRKTDELINSRSTSALCNSQDIIIHVSLMQYQYFIF